MQEHSGGMTTSHDVVTFIIAEHLSPYVQETAQRLCATIKFMSYSEDSSKHEAADVPVSSKRKRKQRVQFNPSGTEGQSDRDKNKQQNAETEELHNTGKRSARQVEVIAKSGSGCSLKCKCGSTSHMRTTHSDCPMNPKRQKKGKT